MKKFNFFKQQPRNNQSKVQPEVETAIIITQFENGGTSVGYLNVQGLKMKRAATMQDMYRMVCEVKGQLESIQTAERVAGMFQETHPIQKSEAKPEVKQEEKSEEIKEGNGGYSGNVAENPEAPKES